MEIRAAYDQPETDKQALDVETDALIEERAAIEAENAVFARKAEERKAKLEKNCQWRNRRRASRNTTRRKR